MAQSRLGRREVLVGAGAGAAGALAVLGGLGNATLAKADDGSGDKGLYLIVVTSATGAQPPFHATVAIGSGGITAVNDASHAPGSTYLGTWDRGDGLELRFIQFEFSNPTKNIGYVRVDARADTDSTSISGTYTVTFVPYSGSTQQVDHGTFAGKRITV